jgi:AcrR family transcriptional regulator
MTDVKSEPGRGRPRTLDPEHLARTAMMHYWSDGPDAVSLNEICKLAGVSKPGLYRDFGSEDGLQAAALDLYQKTVLAPIYAVLDKDIPFHTALEDLIDLLLQDRSELGLPDGCLHVALRQSYDRHGALTKKKTDIIRRQTLERYEVWIDKAKASGQFDTNLPSKTVARYIDAQSGMAMTLQKEGVSRQNIREMLRLALSVFG